MDEVFAISGIIEVEVTVTSRSRRLRLITLTETLIFPDIAKTESNNCFIIHCFTGKQNNGKQFQHLCPSCLRASERFFPSGIRGTVPSQFLSAFFCFPSLFVSAIFQFLARLKKRIDEPLIYFAFRWTRCLPHCFWKSCNARATYRLFTNLLADW